MTTDLRALVRATLAQSAHANPNDLATEVFDKIPSTDYGFLLRYLLKEFVRRVIHENRSGNQIFPTDHPRPDAHPVVVGGEQAKPRVRSSRSAKVRAIREAWQARLRDRYSIGRSWKFLGDCTFDDLMAAASERRDLAKSNSAIAEELERYAQAVQQHKAAHLRDLPADVLRDLLGDKAA